MGSQLGFEEHRPLAPIDWLAALMIFVFPLITTAIHYTAIYLPNWLALTIFFIFLSSIMIALILAASRSFPPWSLSYIGLVLTIMVFYSLGIILWGLLIYPAWMLIFGPMDSWSLIVRLLYGGLMKGFTWILVLLIALFSVVLLRHWPKFTALWEHIRGDWTNLSYLLYGGFVFFIWLTFDEYQHEDPWIFAAFASLAAGAWLYLLAKGKKTRILTLLSGVTAAMGMIALGKWNLVPMQNWPVNLESERLYESLAAIASWISMSIALIAPALLNFIPSFPKPITEERIVSA